MFRSMSPMPPMAPPMGPPMQHPPQPHFAQPYFAPPRIMAPQINPSMFSGPPLAPQLPPFGAFNYSTGLDHPGQAVGRAEPPATFDDNGFRASIAERFAGAYEAQLGHLSRVAAEEERILKMDIDSLRNMAYIAQHSAAEQRDRTDHHRRALHMSAQESFGIRQQIAQVQHELRAQTASVQNSRAQIRQEEAASAELRGSAQREISELEAQCEAARTYRLGEEQIAVELKRALEVTRAERLSEERIASDSHVRLEAAVAAKGHALRGLTGHEEYAMRTMREAVATIEEDFQRERADFRERDRRTLTQIQELERQLNQRRYPGGTNPNTAAT